MSEVKDYWLHRISHESEVAYPLLLKHNYLSIGWSDLANDETVKVLRDLPAGERENAYRKLTEAQAITTRSRWNLFNFFKMKAEDIIVVPMFSGDFALYRVVEPARRFKQDEDFTLTTDHGDQVLFTPNGPLYKETGKEIDLGFVIQVEPLKERSPRILAEAALVSRMKIRIATVCITDLKDEVEQALVATEPPNLHVNLQNLFTAESVNSFYYGVTPDQFENLIRSYMLQLGADRVRIPAKNETGKEVGTDADVIAEFDDLKINIYIQAKKHVGKSNETAVEQIKKYADTMIETENEINHILWAVSTAEFDDAANLSALGKVRLIGGREFMSMLLNAGLQNMKNGLN